MVNKKEKNKGKCKKIRDYFSIELLLPKKYIKKNILKMTCQSF